MTALASYLTVKSEDGQWLVRIEDLDPPREIAGMAARQLASLAEFGLVSDAPVVFQSQRTVHYEQALDYLLGLGKAFYCHCSRSQLAADNGIHRRCVNSGADGAASIRLRVPDLPIEFNDGVCGPQRQDLAREVGDFVLKRTDGHYAYQLAVVVDDALQGISQIVRGADLLDSTPRQILLQRELGYPTPDYLHIPLVLDENGAKLSKSHWATALDDQDRFLALRAAWRHLGQDTGLLRSASSMPETLEIAVRHFNPLAMRALGARGQP